MHKSQGRIAAQPDWLRVGDVRAFQPTPLKAEEIIEILSAAALAPSAANVQPWEFLAITDPRVREAIAALVRDPFLREPEAAPWLAKAPFLRTSL